MTKNDQQKIEVEAGDSEILVVDPENYQETKKLEAIHNAKEHVREVRKENPGHATRKEWKAYNTQVATAVCDFGSELLPIIEDALAHGTLDEQDLETGDIDVIRYIKAGGAYQDENGNWERHDSDGSMAVYRQLERIMRKLGLGLDMEEDTGPAQI